MKICIASSTAAELELLRKRTVGVQAELHFLTHGVGMMNSLFTIQDYLLKKPCDLFIQCGVAGSYVDRHQPGDVVFVKKDQFECGAEEINGSLLSLSDLNLDAENPSNVLINPSSFPAHIPEVGALTVSVCSGTPQTIHRRRNQYHADIESMEGAACHYVALKTNTTFFQFRGISNHVEPRNREAWRMKEAITAYSEVITQWIETL